MRNTEDLNNKNPTKFAMSCVMRERGCGAVMHFCLRHSAANVEWVFSLVSRMKTKT